MRGSAVISDSTGWCRSTCPPTMRSKMSRSVSTPRSRPSGSHTKTESPVPGPLDRAQAVGEAGPGRHGHGMAAAEDAQALVGQGWDATGDHAFGEVGHARSVDRPCARWVRAGSLAPHGSTARPLGIGLVVVSAAGFASGSILAAPIYADGRRLAELVGWRFLIGAALGWLWVLGSSRRRPRSGGDAAPPGRQSRSRLARSITGNAGTYYAGLETVPAALAGVLVYMYPVFVAVLSLRFATRLPGRRPWIALALAVAGVRAGARRHRRGRGAAGQRAWCWCSCSGFIYSVWIVLSARLSGERRDRLGSEALERRPTTARDAAVTTAVMMTATAAVFGSLVASWSGRPLHPGAVPAEAWPFLVAIGVGRVVPGDPDVLRRVRGGSAPPRRR